MGFKYVNFSRRTARNNPNMIIREYHKVINDEQSKLDKFLDKKYEVSLNSQDPYKITSEMSRYGKVKVNVDFEEIEEFYNKIVSRNQYEFKLLKHIREIKDELGRFTSKYKN